MTVLKFDKKVTKIVECALSILILFSAMRVVSAETLYDTIIILIDSHKRVAAAKSDLAAAQERANMTVGEWFPTLGVTANYGYEYQRKGQGSADTSLPPRNVELSLSQLLWDWGATNSTIHRAQLEVEQSKLSLRSARQSVILEAISGYLEVSCIIDMPMSKSFLSSSSKIEVTVCQTNRCQE